MAGSQIATSVTVLNSLLGFQAVSLTNMDSAAVPQIAAGSKVEIASSFFTFSAAETIDTSTWTAITTGQTAYIKLLPAGTAGSQTVTAEWTATAPVWSTSKQGWYASAGSSYRYVGGCFKGSASEYSQKFIVMPEQNYISPKTKVLCAYVGRELGSLAVPASSGVYRIAALSASVLTCINITAQTLTAYEWDGSVWATIGNAFSLPIVSTVSTAYLDTLSSSALALAQNELNTHAVRYITWDGSNFASSGTVYSANSPLGVVKLTSTLVALTDYDGSAYLQSLAWSGSAWSAVGSASTSGWTALCQRTNDSVVLNNSTGRAVARYNSSAWTLVGNTTYPTIFTYPTKVTAENVISGDGSGQISFWTWNAGTWIQVAPETPVVSGTAATTVAWMGDDVVAVIDNSTDTLRAYSVARMLFIA